jgi:hypothetical protein
MRTFTCAAIMLAAVALLLRFGGAAFAQAGSTGGTVGKTDKAVSGAGEEQAPAPRRNSTSAKAAPVEKNSRCNVVGTWSASWQGIGAGSDVWIIKSDGSASATSGYQGTWTCTDGAFVATFNHGFGSDRLVVSASGRSMSGTTHMGTPISAIRR